MLNPCKGFVFLLILMYILTYADAMTKYRLDMFCQVQAIIPFWYCRTRQSTFFKEDALQTETLISENPVSTRKRIEKEWKNMAYAKWMWLLF